MAVKEPKFMQELHKIRAQMAEEWKKMPSKEISKSLRSSSKWLDKQINCRLKKICRISAS